jgi:hypothetical protein
LRFVLSKPGVINNFISLLETGEGVCIVEAGEKLDVLEDGEKFDDCLFVDIGGGFNLCIGFLGSL